MNTAVYRVYKTNEKYFTAFNFTVETTSVYACI